MKIIKLLFAFTLISLLSAGHHPFYVTVTEIEYSSKNKELGISLKTFPDDLEEALRKFSGKNMIWFQERKNLLEMPSTAILRGMCRCSSMENQDSSVSWAMRLRKKWSGSITMPQRLVG